MSGPRVVLLAGGTGGAKLAVGLQAELPDQHLIVIANTADDVDLWGLRISPDLDSVLFRLAGIFNEEAGFGVVEETFNTHSQMKLLGAPDWFWLGDRDLAFHLIRSELLRSGRRPSEVSLELGRRLGLLSQVLPMSDEEVRTVFETKQGRLGFQEYFVREKLRPEMLGYVFEGAAAARPSPEAAAALAAAQLVIIGPSNPLISIGPLLEVLGSHLERERTVAVSPLVGGRALKGPTAEMLIKARGAATPEVVAREYARVAGGFVLDKVDSDCAAHIAALGYRVAITDTLMPDREAARRLAREILGAWTS
ncbi:MAG: 2-phospho-L-lactate transferase [Candidatus Dormibacter sp.]|uniref:2-phospho-L-lactate transferase n=1 Tax=Candidatus Dormibacter sp. TaxID=2973982 RepID=UPI000DB1060F|nr:MAG: 2-phospho-L-lactate transferase [Candidatus Dormibacteraeota bacterium]